MKNVKYMVVFDWEIRAFEDIAGNLRIIKPCPIRRLGALKQYLDLLQSVIASAPPYDDFPSAYRGSRIIQAVVKEILTICKISTDWVNLPMVEELIHHRRSDDGTFLPGLLVEINFPQARTSKKNSPPIRRKEVALNEWIVSSIVALVATNLAPDLGRAIEIADSMGWDELESYLATRYYQLNPKLKDYEELEALNSSPPGREDELILAAASMALEGDGSSDIDISSFL